mmetsp:Transcript_125427/g.297843  ORF Transcript_125427/g.297843 Transcript_125427/m.297843 type:complete len:333 (-) Transcript_125427:370-1368(-)
MGDQPLHEKLGALRLALLCNARIALCSKVHLAGIWDAELRKVEALAFVGLGHRLWHVLPCLGTGGDQAPRGEGVPEIVEALHRVVPQLEHAEVHLGPALVVTHVELEEGDALKQRRALSHLQNRFEVALDLFEGTVVLLNHHRSAGELALVRVEEHLAHMCRRVRGVETVVEPLFIKLREVVPRHITHRLGIFEGVPEDRHLPQGGPSREVGASRANAEGERHGEVDPRPGDVQSVLRVEHGIDGAEDGAAELLRLLDPWQFQIRLVDHDHFPQGGVVATVFQEALFKELPVGLPDLLEAVEVCGEATLRALDEVVVAEPWDHRKVQLLCFI